LTGVQQWARHKSSLDKYPTIGLQPRRPVRGGRSGGVRSGAAFSDGGAGQPEPASGGGRDWRKPASADAAPSPSSHDGVSGLSASRSLARIRARHTGLAAASSVPIPRPAPAWVPILAGHPDRVRAKALKAQASGVAPWSESRSARPGAKGVAARGASVRLSGGPAFPSLSIARSPSVARTDRVPRLPLRGLRRPPAAQLGPIRPREQFRTPVP
jgi:hypothetical protein